MKTVTQIRTEKPFYFVSIEGQNLFESESLKECKDFLINQLKVYKENKIKILETYNYFIGMYNIGIE